MGMKTNLIEGLSKLSNIDSDILAKLVDIMGECIIEAVYEDRLRNITTSEIDLGFITLSISNDDSKLKIKAIPSKELMTDLTNVEKGKNPKLKLKLEKNVIAKLQETYKELL